MKRRLAAICAFWLLAGGVAEARCWGANGYCTRGIREARDNAIIAAGAALSCATSDTVAPCACLSDPQRNGSPAKPRKMPMAVCVVSPTESEVRAACVGEWCSSL